MSLSNCSKTNVFDKMIDLIDNTNRKNDLKYLSLATNTYCPILSKYKIYELGGDFLYSDVESYIRTNLTLSLINYTNNIDDSIFLICYS